MVYYYLASKNVTRKKERSILTIVGVLLAVGAFVSLLSIAEGLYQRVQREVRSRNVDLYLLPRNSMPLPAGPIGGLALTTEVVPPHTAQDLINMPPAPNNIDAAEPVIRFQQLHEGRGMVVWGLNPAAFDKFLPYMRLSPTGRIPRAKNEILMGLAMARALEVTEGSNFVLAGRPFDIVGLFKSGSSLEDYFSYILPEAAAEITGRADAQEVWIKLKDPSTAEATAADINRREAFADYVARTRSEYLGAANEFLNYAWLLQFGVAAIGVLIATTAAMNTMLMSTYERLREFATLRAIGASRMTVIAMIGAESMLLSLAGGVIGIVLGIMGSKLLDSAVVTLFKMAFPIASVNLPLLAESLALALFIGVVGAIIPCFLVYRMNIISGLRQE